MDLRRDYSEPLIQDQTPKPREDRHSKTFKRRSTNADQLQRSIQLLDEALSPSIGSVSRPQGGFRSRNNTPIRSKAPSAFDRNELFTFASAKKKPTIEPQRQDNISLDGGFPSVPVQHTQMDITLGVDMTEDFTQSDLTFFHAEDPGLKGSSELYEAFKNSLKSCTGPHQILELVSAYESSCGEHVEHLEKINRGLRRNQPKLQKARGTLEILKKEKQTWQLVRSLFKDRLEVEMKTDLDDSMDSDMKPGVLTKPKVWGMSEQNIINSLFEKDSLIRQSQLVIDWLEVCSFEDLNSQSENVKFLVDQPVEWENTLHHLQKIKKGLPQMTDRAIVTEMDPDAPHRQKRNLDNVDHEDERCLLRNIFVLLRAGQLDQAIGLCQTYGQPWRAATLEGWRLYHDPNYESNPGPDGQLLPVEGNSFRDVWKVVCWRMANEPEYDRIERAIYASLSGNLESLLPACLSWMDYLWAYYKVMVDIRVEQEVCLRRNVNRSLDSLPAEFWDKLIEPHQIFKEISASTKENIWQEAENWYHVIQKFIILGDIAGLIETMHSWLQTDGDTLPEHLLRLMAHLVLFLKSIGQACKDELCESILMAYVKSLILDKSRKSLVAFYVAFLTPSAQVQWYANFLEGIEEQGERRQCLAWAEEVGLDIAAITKMVVETIRSKETLGLPVNSLAADITVTPEDKAKIDAIDWLTFDENHRPEAIKQANALMRTFIVVKKHTAARQVFSKLASDTVDVIYRLWHLKTGSSDLPPNDANAIREYMCMRAYLDAVESFSDWFTLYHQGQPEKPANVEGGSFTDRVALEHKMKQYNLEHSRWMHNLLTQTKTTRDRIYNILLFPDGGWLVDATEQDDDDEEEESRQYQMSQLRKLHIPALCLNLHTVLHSSGLYVEAVQIADVLASEMHQLYKLFDLESMAHLLQQISKSSLSLLNQNKDPIGYELV